MGKPSKKSTTGYHVLIEKVPFGSHKLRLEFEVTESPDIRAGKGVPGHAQLYFDDKLVGHNDSPTPPDSCLAWRVERWIASVIAVRRSHQNMPRPSSSLVRLTA